MGMRTERAPEGTDDVRLALVVVLSVVGSAVVSGTLVVGSLVVVGEVVES